MYYTNLLKMKDKALNQYKIKSQNLGLKDIDLGKRQVAMYLSHFDNIDSDNDLITKGAFKKSLQERGVDSPSNRKIAFLRYHDWTKPIGKFLKLEEDETGLFAVGELGSSSIGNDALLDYQEGIIKEHSIGFRYISDKIKWIEDNTKEEGGYYLISEVALWEGSAVTFGANELTPVLQVAKGMDKKDSFNQITKELEVIVKSLSSGQGTDERLYSLEMKHKFLLSQIEELYLMDNEIIVKKDPEIITEKSFDWNKVLNNL